MRLEVLDPITFDDARENPNQSDFMALILEDERRKRATWTMRRLNMKWNLMKTRRDVLKHYFEYFNFLVFAVEVNNSGGPDAVSKCIGSYLGEPNPRKRKFKAYENGDDVLLKNCGASKRGTVVSFVPELSTVKFDTYKVRMWKSGEMKHFKHIHMTKWRTGKFKIGSKNKAIVRDASENSLNLSWQNRQRRPRDRNRPRPARQRNMALPGSGADSIFPQFAPVQDSANVESATYRTVQMQTEMLDDELFFDNLF